MIKLTSINHQEALRYLGAESSSISEDWNIKLNTAAKEIMDTSTPRWHSDCFNICELIDDVLIGEDIKNLLNGCKKCILFCATLGNKIERILRLNQVTNMAYAVMLDACASAAIEQVCDDTQILLAEKYKSEGLFLTSRFSCGYGDLPLSVQNRIIHLLDAPRKIGLSVNHGGLLIPTKSVTAIIGLSEVAIKPRLHSCAICNLKESCQFRRKGVPCAKELE